MCTAKKDAFALQSFDVHLAHIRHETLQSFHMCILKLISVMRLSASSCPFKIGSASAERVG